LQLTRPGTATHAGARTIADIVPGCGPLGGIHAALTETRARTLFVVACDTPYITAALVEHLFALSDAADVVVPCGEDGYHPLCAVYSRACLDPIARRLARGRLKVIDLLDEVRTRTVRAVDLERFGDPRRLLANVNTPADYRGLANIGLTNVGLDGVGLDDLGLDDTRLEALHDHTR